MAPSDGNRSEPFRLRRAAITLIKRHPIQDSLPGRMLGCGYNTDFLTEALTLSHV